MTTNAYAAKRAIIGRLQEAAASAPADNVLYQRQVAYAWPGAAAEQVCIYGGGVTFDQPEEDEVSAGNRDRVPYELATVSVHIRVAMAPPPENGIAGSDELAEAIGEELGRVLLAEPDLAGGQSVARITGGVGDYSPDLDSAISTLSYRITVGSYVTQGGP